ncbi:hypothetical protein AQUCO_02100181v1 [Aquilegia coerulea]|uniref:RING-CH-type domain-containing protein n=1 Tax=Aquilegia coerulea TaxID=218851 RepID=A0A2G5DFZ0_AQUCA|nr:hypothetical protein AQUCO_02100181v1 [Aquilegia coerulea]
MQNQQETNQDSSSSSSSSSAAKAATTETEAVIVVRSTEEEEDDEMEKCNMEKEKVKSNILVKLSEEETEKKKQNNCVIVDIKDECDFGGILLNNNNKDGEKVCRICHLNAAECTSSSSAAEKLDLIKLGCGCKDELGIAHRHCAEAWFKLKGNRRCEICGETAKNITGVGDDRFMEEWNERSDESSGNTDQRRGFFRGQPFCNFLMACLVILFVIPWFFHVNMV